MYTIMLYNLKVCRVIEYTVIRYACAITDGRMLKNDPEEQVV